MWRSAAVSPAVRAWCEGLSGRLFPGRNLLLKGTLAARFSDAQCGFKAIRKDVADVLLPLIQDTGWFFDTELLVLAQRAGLRIHEVPVDWVDDPNSHGDAILLRWKPFGFASVTIACDDGELCCYDWPTKELRTPWRCSSRCN
jgi:hypothetical protein